VDLLTSAPGRLTVWGSYYRYTIQVEGTWRSEQLFLVQVKVWCGVAARNVWRFIADCLTDGQCGRFGQLWKSRSVRRITWSHLVHTSHHWIRGIIQKIRGNLRIIFRNIKGQIRGKIKEQLIIWNAYFYFLLLSCQLSLPPFFLALKR